MQTANRYHTDTGFVPVDAMTYRQQPKASAYGDADTGIILFQVTNYGSAGTQTSACRPVDDPDLLFWGRGTGGEVHGKLAGTNFWAPPTRAQRISFTPRGVDSEVSFSSSAQASNIMFPKGFLANLVSEQNAGEMVPYLFQQNADLYQLAAILERELVSPSFAGRLVIGGVTQAIAGLLARIDSARVNIEADRICLPHWKVRRLFDYVESNLDQTISLDDLAQVAELSPFHFSRVFKRETGLSPYKYVRDRRLERSRDLLAMTDMGIAELSLACGFSNQSHFTAAFSRAMGISPARFRETNRR